MFANGCFVTDGNHRFDDPTRPVPWQGFTTKGPTRIGDNVWCGANVVITSGVTIGERCVIGANSVVTTDLPAVLDRGRRARARPARDRVRRAPRRRPAADAPVAAGARYFVDDHDDAEHDDAGEAEGRERGHDAVGDGRPVPVARAGRRGARGAER